MKERIVNFSDFREKKQLVDEIWQLQGMQRITVVEHRKRRSDRQNRYYWPCFVQPLAEHFRSLGNEVTDKQVHEWLKSKFLQETMIDIQTGDIIGDVTRDSSALNTKEFNEYLDKVAAYLANEWGITVPDPTLYRIVEEENKKLGITKRRTPTDQLAPRKITVHRDDSYSGFQSQHDTKQGAGRKATEHSAQAHTAKQSPNQTGYRNAQ